MLCWLDNSLATHRRLAMPLKTEMLALKCGPFHRPFLAHGLHTAALKKQSLLGSILKNSGTFGFELYWCNVMIGRG